MGARVTTAGDLGPMANYLTEQIEIMRNEFLAIVKRTGEICTATCPEIPEVIGEGRTRMGALVALRVAVVQLLDQRRADATRHAPPDAVLETICIE